MAKKFGVIVMLVFFLNFALDSIGTIVSNNESLKNINLYYINTFFNVVLCLILIGSFMYLYKKYEK